MSAALQHTAEPAGASRIMALFRAFRRIEADISSKPLDLSEEEYAELYVPLDAVRNEMLRTPAQTPADFAAKLIADTADGGTCAGEMLMAEAYRLVGEEELSKDLDSTN